MTVFGNTAIFLDQGRAAGAIATAVSNDVSVALFQFFEYLPLSGVASVLAVLLVTIFFITSSDSGSMVVDTIAAGGTHETPVWQRIYWCGMEGVAAALLLLAGGLKALQTVTLISALPFCVIMILLAVGLVRGMRSDMARSRHIAVATPASEVSWHQRLGFILHTPGREDVERFLTQVARPALESVTQEMRRRGLAATVEPDGDGGIALTIPSDQVRSFVYGLRPQSHLLAAFSAAEAARPEQRRPRRWEARTWFSDGSRGYDTLGFTQDQMIADVLTQYERYRSLVHSSATALYIASPDPA
jgi:choline/glycine/proline betaine transport protein